MLILSRSGQSKARELEHHASAGIAAINAAVDQARRRYITPIAGQDMIYREKQAEAERFLALDPVPDAESLDPGVFPFIAAESHATGQTPQEVAALFERLATEWRQLGAQMEALRIGAIARVRAAAGPADIGAAVAEVVALLEGLS
ncbi:hypothetical protein E7681_18030 [Thalassobius vesicularis]|uniref:Uncharacterized protein n=1 Tax=Thalassobius vesicularis TaxID=1294297 RepID=A0A4S3M5J9_9RHOB|nr:hypothetical protein [Thalassobius vesicularis]THD71402.1 hypothetical protein E7681_18030 [Thalassobius vesicularis]